MANVRRDRVGARGLFFGACVAGLASVCGPARADDPAPPAEWNLRAKDDFRWPRRQKVAVSLTYDDGIKNHHELVGPVLKRHRVRATFYVKVAGDAVDNPNAWRRLARQGHELGSHSLFHPCRKTEKLAWVADHYDLKTYTPGRFFQELSVTNLVLSLLDGKQRRTYGNNCCDITIGSAAGEVRMAPTLARLYPAARGPLNARAIFPVRGFNSMELGTFSADQRTFVELKQEIEAVMNGADAGWLIYMIHGVGEGSHASYIDTAEHEQLIKWLAANSATIWTAPVIDVADHVLKNVDR